MRRSSYIIKDTLQTLNSILLDGRGRPRSGWRAVFFLIAFVIASIVLGVAAAGILAAFHIDAGSGHAVYLVINSAFSLVPAVLLGWLCGRLFEGLPFRALGAAFSKGWFRHFAAGSIAGAATLAFGVAIAMIFGGLRFDLDAAGTDAVARSLAASFTVFAVASAFEEALFRGYILQTFSRSGLAWLAILLTSLFFGVVHLGNPNVTVLSTVNTVLAGIWFSVAYLKTRDLWFVWGMHLMWNWMQGSFFGIEVSGLTSISSAPLLKEIDKGPTWLTGSTYGIEGGIVCTVAIAVSTAVIYLLPVIKPDPELLAMTGEAPVSPQRSLN